MNLPSTHFLHGVKANIAYWRKLICQLTDGEMSLFLREQANIQLAVSIGLTAKDIAADTADLLLLVYPFIERSGQWQTWLLLFEKSEETNLEKYPDRHVRLLNRQGQLRRLLRQTEMATIVHKRAETIAKTVASELVMAEVWFQLAVDYWQQQQYEDAADYGQRSLAVFEKNAGNSRWQATLLNTMGLIASNRYQLQAAQNHLQASLTLWQHFDEPTEIARVLNNLANTYYHQNQLETAFTYYQQAAAVLAATESVLDKSEVFINLGALYFKWQQYDKAELVLRQADTQGLRRSGNFRLRALLAQNLGNTLLRLQRPAEAVPYLQQSLTLWQQLGDDLMRANTSGTLAEALAAQGKSDSAETFYATALTLLERYQDNPWAKDLRYEFQAGQQGLQVCRNQ